MYLSISKVFEYRPMLGETVILPRGNIAIKCDDILVSEYVITVIQGSNYMYTEDFEPTRTNHIDHGWVEIDRLDLNKAEKRAYNYLDPRGCHEEI